MSKVLIVEDEPLVARMYQKALALDGHEVIIAVGGSDGIGKVKSEKPDIVILDIMMPEPNGMEVLEVLRKDPATAKIPVVMLTNLSGSRDAELAKGKGATDYWVKKDVKPSELGRMVDEVLGASKTASNKKEKPNHK